MTRTGASRNERLLSAIKSCGWTYDACAAAVRAVSRENGAEMAGIDRTTVAHWIRGSVPSGSTPTYLAEAVSRRLGATVTSVDLGLAVYADKPVVSTALDWYAADPINSLLTIGRADMERRDFARQALYSVAALSVPLDRWAEIVDRARHAGGGATVGRGEIDAVRQTISMFSVADERFGGGHARAALISYLTTDVAAYLRGSFRTDDDRRAMFSAAAELAYLAGWKSFDIGQQGIAQRYYLLAVRLANEANDAPLASFVMRAMAHQAVDLGHGRACVDLAESALDWSRRNSTPAAYALFTVVKARGHATDRDRAATVRTLGEAERLLANVDWSTEPEWLHRMGFGQTSLSNQTAQALRDLGDLAESERQFKLSIATRDPAGHRRIHALTLANLGDVQFARGHLGESVRSWSKALDHMNGLRSARAQAALTGMCLKLRTLGPRTPNAAKTVDERAREALTSFPANS